MKRIIALVLILGVIFSFGGCREAKNEENKALQNLIQVQFGDTLIKSYENFLWATMWTENGWLSLDGERISRKFSEVYSEIPQIAYFDDFEIHYKEGVEFISLSVYNSDFDIINNNAKQEELRDLAEGTYYLVITVKEQGEYIESEEKYEYACYECVYKLVIDAEISK